MLAVADLQIPRFKGILFDFDFALNLSEPLIISGRSRKIGSDFKNSKPGTSLVAQWLRIRLPVQGTWVRALVLEDTTCCGATKPVHHNY